MLSPFELEINNIAGEIAAEAERAISLFSPMNGPHEAHSVILEEMDEYWDEVKEFNPNKPGRDTRPRQREELIQLAAMALRAIYDTIDHGKVYPKPPQKKVVVPPCDCNWCTPPGLR